MKIPVCPFCGSDVDEDMPVCCGEQGHIQYINVNEEGEEICAECNAPNPTKIDPRDEYQEILVCESCEYAIGQAPDLIPDDMPNDYGSVTHGA